MMLLTLARDTSGRCVGLRLPAEPADITAAYKKLDAVCMDERQTHILRAETGIGSLDRWLRDRKMDRPGDYVELGDLAVKIDAMTEQDRKTFDGALTGAAFGSVDDVRRIADSVDAYIFISGVTTEKDLGRFLVDSGYKGFPESVKPYSDALRSFYLSYIFPLKSLTEYERIIHSYDILCRLASYDDSEYNEAMKTATGARPKAHDLVGFMENNKVVCDGYANVYSWMLMELGIDNYIVHGRANGGGHAWNKVCVGGTWYNADACWDDTSFSVRRYYLKSDEWMMENKHSFTDSFSTTTYQSSESPA